MMRGRLRRFASVLGIAVQLFAWSAGRSSYCETLAGASTDGEVNQCTSGEESRVNSQTWRDERNCGPVSLYSLAKLCDHATSLEAIMDHAPPGPDGVDLSALQAASEHIGFSTMAIRFRDVDYLQRLDSPFIAHLSASRRGHFVVVLYMDKEQVVLGEGITARVQREPTAKFLRDASGFVLVPTAAIWKERGVRLLYSLTVLLAVFALGQFWGLFRRGKASS